MKHKIEEYIHLSIKNLWENQPNLSTAFSEGTLEHEPNLSFHIANELWKYLPDYDCDFDIIKANFDNKRPDIIFHKRWTHDENLLVLEVKRFSNRNVESGICRDDENKIIQHWFSSPLNYKYWVSLVFDEVNKAYWFALIINNAEKEIIRFWFTDRENR